MDAPPAAEEFAQILDQIGSDDVLMFATDYPHWHFDRPDDALLPDVLGDTTIRKIMAENARAWYSL
jgi:predicted TIM-barrel fold metal-dependent hydrolase